MEYKGNGIGIGEKNREKYFKAYALKEYKLKEYKLKEYNINKRIVK